MTLARLFSAAFFFILWASLQDCVLSSDSTLDRRASQLRDFWQSQIWRTLFLGGRTLAKIECVVCRRFSYMQDTWARVQDGVWPCSRVRSPSTLWLTLLFTEGIRSFGERLVLQCGHAVCVVSVQWQCCSDGRQM